MTARSPKSPVSPPVYLAVPSVSSGSQFRVVLLGSGHVGKTSLVWRLVHDRFLYQYNPTVEDSYRHLVQLPDGRFKSIEILDTAGAHQFPAMRELNIKRGQAFFVVYSIDDYQSFVEAVSLIDLIERVKYTNASNAVPIVLVGNKLDLADECRAVSTDEANRAAILRRCAFAETSAKTADLGQTVDVVFGQLLMHGFDVPLAVTVTSSGGGSLTRATATGGGSMKVSRSLSARRRLGRSRSAGIMSTPNAGGGTAEQQEKTMQCRHLAANNVQQQQAHSCLTNNQTLHCREAEELQDSRCVIL